MKENIHDVVIVGAGPVGLALGRTLGLRGHDVTILERWPQPYPLPRAVHFNDDIGRAFQSMGITDEVEKIAVTDTTAVTDLLGHCHLRLQVPISSPNKPVTAATTI